MSGFLQNLRKKSSETRKRIALGTSMAVTGLIFVMWVTVLNNGFISNDADIQQLNTEATQTASPLSAFSENAASAFQQLKKSINSGEVSTTTTSTSSDNSQQLEDDPSTYWADHRQGINNNDSTTNENEVPQTTFSNESKDNNEEPFTSRNYNPNEESDWFDE